MRAQSQMRLGIVSWNVHKCVGGLDRRYDPERVAALLQRLDAGVILLQEVAQGGRWYRHERQIDRLGDLLGMSHRSFFVNVRFGPRRGEYGNALLTRYPIVESSNIDLTVAGRKPRSVLHARLQVPLPENHSRTLHVFNMHLGLGGRERHDQLRRFVACDPFAHLHRDTPIVVGGDLNDVWGTLGRLHLRPLGFTGPERPLRTFPAYAPLRALDTLWCRGAADLEHLHVVRLRGAKTASDHRPLHATLGLH